MHGEAQSFSSDAKQALAAYRLARKHSRDEKRDRARAGFRAKARRWADDLPENVRASLSGPSLALARLQSLEDMEKEVIMATLEATHYKITRAAEILGISRKTLLDKRKRYGLK